MIFINPKSILKNIKLHESQISMVLGGLVVIAVSTLVINYFRGLPKAVTDRIPAGEAPSTEVSEVMEVTEKEGVHIVQKGESLWSISEKYYQTGFEWTKIADANEIASPDNIEVGQELVIPSQAPSNEQISDEAMTTDSTISTETYIVQKGDSLWDIALRAYGDGYRWVDIARENNLSNPDLIHHGNVLNLPK